MNKKTYIAGAALMSVFLMGMASASAANLLLDFQFNEGKGSTSVSSVNSKTILSLGDTTIDPSASPKSMADDFFPAGDLVANFANEGWSRGEFENRPWDLKTPLTWEAWVYVDPENALSTYQDLFNLGDTIKIGFNTSGQFEMTARAIVDVVSDAVYGQQGVWTHMACVWEPGVGVTFYQDGAFMDQVGWDGKFRDYQANILTIGSGNTGASTFFGKLNRVRMHKVALTESQLDTDPSNPKPVTADTVFSYDFNEPDSTTFADKGFAGVTLSSGVEWRIQESQIQFSDSTPIRDVDPDKAPNDYSVYVDNSEAGENAIKYGLFDCDTIDFGDQSDKSFSMEAWFKGLARSTVKQVFFQLWSSTTGNCPRIAFAINTDFTVMMTTMGVADIYTHVPIPEDGGWHHIACTFDAVNHQLKTYVDGELGGVITDEQLSNWNVLFGTQSEHPNRGIVGAEHTGFAPFTGYVDRLRFWKGVISAQELDYEYYGEALIPPTVKTDPRGGMLFNGAKVNLKAEFVGTDTEDYPMTMQWYRGNEVIPGATGNVLEVIVSEETAGDYYATATNVKGSASTKTAKITVDSNDYQSTLIMDMPFNEGKGSKTESTVAGIEADLGDGIEWEPSMAASLVEDDFFAKGDKVLNLPGIGWLKGKSNTPLLDLTEAFTWETWIYFDPETSKEGEYQGYVTYSSLKMGENPNHEWLMTFSGVKDFNSGIVMQYGWQHIAASWVPGEKIYFYVNGAYAMELDAFTTDSTTGQTVPLMPLVNTDYSFNLGCEATAGNTMAGKLNRTRLHRGVLKDDPYADFTDVLDCDPANPKPVTSSVVLAFNYDDEELPCKSASSPELLADDQSKAYIDTLNEKMVQWSEDSPTGKEGDYSLKFSGSNAATIDPLALKLVESDEDDYSYTIEVWVKGEVKGNRQILFANYGLGRFSFSLNEKDYSVYATTFGIDDMSSSAVVPQDGKWHHVAFCINTKAGQRYYYVDGVLSDWAAYTGGMNYSTSNTTPGFIGSENGGNYFTGNMDRLRVHKGVVLPANLDYYSIDPTAVPEIKEIKVSAPAVEVGGTVTMTVVAIGAKTYQWYRNDVAIEGARSDTLKVEDATLASGGQYTVKVSNDNGGVTSDAIPVVVNPVAGTATELLNFQFNEGEGFSTASSVSGAMANFGYTAVNETHPVTIGVGPSGMEGDGAAAFDGMGSALIGWTEKTLDLNQPFTFEAWVYRSVDAGDDYEDFFRIGNTVKVGLTKTKTFEMTYLGKADIYSDLIMDNTGTWMHIAAVAEPGVGVTFFKDGVEINKTEYSGSPRDYQNDVITLGADNACTASLFMGMLDRVRLHQAALTAAELDSDSKNPKPVTDATILAYNFDDEDAPFASTGSEDATLVDYYTNAANPEWVSGPAGGSDKALAFYGVSFAKFNTDGIDFGDQTDPSFSLEAWIKDIPVKSSRQVLFQTQYNDTSSCPALSFSVSPNYTVHFTALAKADVDTGVAIPEPDGQWHEIAVSYNHNAGLVAVYIDGELAGTKAYSNGVSFGGGWPTIGACLGAELGLGLPTTGMIDRVRMWKGVVNPADLDYPAVPESQPDLAYSVDAEGNLVLRWAVSAGASLEVAPTAEGPWTLAGEPVIESGVMTYTVKTTGESGYYRLVSTRLGGAIF